LGGSLIASNFTEEFPLNTTSDTAKNIEPLLKTLQTIVGADHVITDRAERAFYSADVFFESTLADVVVQPGSKDELAHAVAEATRIDYAVVPRISASASWCRSGQAARTRWAPDARVSNFKC
jgi:hypothetical protein